jgi:hypothetical protein
MRKIGLICLALILAMGSLGVGYAMWSDTITINGSVDTASLKLGISKAWYGEPWGEYLDKDVGDVFCYQAGAVLCTVLYGQDVTDVTERAEFIISNAYPGYRPSIWIDVANCGTIPVHITNIVVTAEQVVEGGPNIPLIVNSVTPGQGYSRAYELCDQSGCIITMSFVNLVCSQIHSGDYDNVEIDFGFPSNDLPQETTYLITVTVYGEQWAE